MEQQIAVVTLGTKDSEKSRRFYEEGFGWKPVFENQDIVFYQMNGFVFGVLSQDALAEDANVDAFESRGAFTLAHNVRTEEDVRPLMQRLLSAGATLTREADSPPQGGLRGYVADPDGHLWEIAYNPGFPIDEDGHVAFGT